ncbi:MAG: rod shape-determining protein MreC [Salinivirgaceae bacterium]
MRSLLNFFYTYHFIILFLLMEFFSFFLLIQYNDYQKASFLNSSNQISGIVYKKFSSISQYLSLKDKNLQLMNIITDSRNTSLTSFKQYKVPLINVYDTIYQQQYQFLNATVINNSVNKSNNFLTLNIGRKQGIDKGMAVVSPEGIVGVVKDVSANYASVISLLNQNLKISAMFKKSGYFGSINWNGANYQYITFSELPSHVSVAIGDTVITSGYSAMFPKGELVGIVSEVDKSETGEFIEVKVQLAVDFKKLQHVMVIKNFLLQEQIQLETESSHD